MTACQNDEKLGVMVAEGLSGPLCWAVTLFQQRNSACIESVPAPASPTEEELVAAKAWQAWHRREQLGLPALATDAECEVAEEAPAPAAEAAADAADDY